MSNDFITAIISIVGGWLAAILTTLKKKSKRKQEKEKALENGVQSLLRAEIIRQYEKYQEKGYAPIYAKEAITREYAAYHELGGNDVATELYNAVMNLPTSNLKK